MSSYNRIILIGRLACEVEKKVTNTGLSYARFRLAVDRRVRKNGDSPNNVDFIPIVAWDRLADICASYLTKGKLVCIEGRLHTRTYEDNAGQKRYSFDVVADDMRMLSTGNGSNNSGVRSNTRSDYEGYSEPVSSDPFANDGDELDPSTIPF